MQKRVSYNRLLSINNHLVANTPVEEETQAPMLVYQNILQAKEYLVLTDLFTICICTRVNTPIQ